MPALGPGCAALNRQPNDPPAVAPPAARAVPSKAERELQQQVEGWLSIRGYRRLTADNATRPAISEVPVRGYFGHLAKPRGNPLMLDLWILAPSGRYLMIELKASRSAAFQPGQRELVEQGYGHIAYDFEEACLIVLRWETGAFETRGGR